MRLGSELRTGWRAWLGLPVLIGLVGAAAVAAAAGARRTETAYPRVVQAQNGYDLITGGVPRGNDPGRGLGQKEGVAQGRRRGPRGVAAAVGPLAAGPGGRAAGP